MAKGEVRYRLVLDSKAFVDGIKAAKNEANAMANDLSSKLGKAGSVLSAMGPAGLAAAAGVGALAAAAGAAVKATIEATSAAMKYADSMEALQDKTGLSTKALQDLEVAAKLGNSSLEAVASAVNKMQKNLVDGSTAFGKLGLSIKDLKAQSPEQQFRAVAVAIENINDPAQRAAARIAVFGKSGNDLAGTLKAAAAGATELGGALSGDAIKAAAGLQDQADLLETAWDRVVLQFGAAVAQSPELKKLLEDLTSALVKMAETVARLAPLIASLFDNMIRGAKLAFAAMQSLELLKGGFVGMAGQHMQSALDEFNLPSFGDVKSGGSSSAIKPGHFSGAADDKAAAEAARAAERVRAAWQKASEDARADWDKFYSHMHERDGDMLQDQKKVIAEMAKNHAARVMQELDDSRAIEEAEQRIIEETSRRQFEANQQWVQGLSDVAAAMAQLGDVTGGTFGTLLGLGGAAVQVFANLKNQALQAASTTQKLAGAISAAASILSGPGGKKGALSGAATGAMAGAAFGGIGAVIGGVAGGILGFFGGGGKKAKQEEQQKQIQDTIGKLSDLMAKAKQLKMDQLQGGVAGLAAMFGYLGKQTEISAERFERLGRFGVAMFNELRSHGMSAVEAFNAMGPSLDAAMAAFEKAGGTINAAFADLLQFRQKVTENEDLVNAVEGFNDLITAMPLNKDSIVDVQAELKSMFDDLISKGFTTNQALQLLAPTLLQIRDAARDGRIQIDEGTQSLITQADTAGLFENLQDPMKELVEVQKMMLELWAAIAHMQGVTLPESLRRYLDELNHVGNAVGNIPSPGGGPPPSHGGDVEPSPAGAAIGFSTPSMPYGSGPGGMSYVGVHPGEAVNVSPHGGRPRNDWNVGPIVLKVDDKVLGEVHIGQMRKNRGGMRSQTRRYVR